MSLFARVLGGRGETKVVDADNLTRQMLQLPSSKTGIAVDELRALRVSAVWDCCKVLCEDIGKVPLKLMQEQESGSNIVAKKHPLHRVLNRRPNEWQTSMQWRMQMMLHALLKKGAYSFINRDRATGEVLELIPLNPNRVCVKQDRAYQLTYELDINGKKTVLPRRDVHTIHGLSWNGYSAIELISAGTEAIALALATEESQARLHGQGVRPGGIVSTTAALDDEQIDKIRADFAANYSGLDNAFATLLLDQGLKYEAWAMTGVDAQHLETRRHQIEEVARLFRVFPSMIGYSDKAATYASAESFFIAHVVHTLMPWFVGWEQALERDLLTEDEIDRGFYVKFFEQGLLRGDAKTRAEFYASGIRDGWMTRNEARRFEDLNPLPGLDKPLIQSTMTDGTVIAKPAPPPVPGAPPPGAPPPPPP